MTFTFLKKKFATLLIISLWIIPVNSFAFSIGAGGMVPGLPFGGFSFGFIPCLCSGNSWIVFMPLSPLPLPKIGSLVYQPGYTTLYGDFAIGAPYTWHLGSYTPIVGNGACWIETAVACVPLPNLGLMNKVGTGLP